MMPAKGSVSPNDLKRLRIGMAESEIVAMLGEPEAKVVSGDALTPSRAFRDLGSQFHFPDAITDVVWTYRYAHRPRVLLCLGLKDGKLLTTWRMTQSAT